MKLRFTPAPLTERAVSLPDPGRGWYRMYPFDLALEPELSLLAGEALPLVMLRLDVGAYRDGPIPTEALERAGRILACVRDTGHMAIVRFVYDTQGRGLEREPSAIGTVQGHLRQIGQLLTAYAPCILLYQGMLVGSWGEMHGSRYLNAQNLRLLAETMREAFPASVPLAVRQPVQWRCLHAEGACPGNGEVWGLFNDALFSTTDELGTFGTQPKAQAGWSRQWQPEDELALETRISEQIPFGGEALPGLLSGQTADKVAYALRSRRLMYLNADWSPELLAPWKEIPCGVPGVWQDVSLYDYVGAHLGYRFLVTGLDCRINRLLGTIHIDLTVKNTGFAGLYSPAGLTLAVRSAADGSVLQEEKLPVALDGITPGGERQARLRLPLRPGVLFLRAALTDGRQLELANDFERLNGEMRIGEIC